MALCCGCYAATQAGLRVHHAFLMQEPQILYNKNVQQSEIGRLT